MDRRTVLALVLVAAVILLTPQFFPSGPRIVPVAQDSGLVADTAPLETAPVAATRAEARPPREPEPSPRRPLEGLALAPAETVTVTDSVASYRFVSDGAALASVSFTRFRALGGRDGSVELRGRNSALISVSAVVGRDTVRFDRASYQVSRSSTSDGVPQIVFSGGVGEDSLTLAYTVVPDSFLVRLSGVLRGRIANQPGTYILLGLPPTLESFEADTADDQRSLAFAYEPVSRDAKGIRFSSLDPGEREIAPGPHDWVALKNKYFIMGLLALEGASPIVEFGAVGLPRTSRTATQAQGTAVIQPAGGSFSVDLYTGPQQWTRLQAVGRDFENSNPYGGFLQPVVQPFAVLVMRILLWMRGTLDLGYGWVLVIFGIAVRLVLWPLNQGAMRNSLKMQRIQPELSELQKRYKSDPQKLQTEMMRVYREHGMSPFSMFSGCLPLLLPMPVLFALFFVFQSTIEFRGVSFMYLADISLKDPFYILPIAMGASMFLLTWIGSRNMPPNPQTKIMGYVFPVMMTFLLANLAAGLNLYYAVQNIAALPQQWLIARERERQRAQGPKKK